MTKINKPTISDKQLGINPFTLNLKIPVSKVTMAGQFRRDDEGDVLPVEVMLEKDASTRVYVDATRRKHMVGLSPRGKDLFMWLIYEVENGHDWIWINYRRYMEECEVKTYNTYKTALNELVAKGIITSTVVQHVYWINPHFFFNGSRVNKFPDNVVKR